MYPIYIQTNQLSLNDHLQLQALLAQREHVQEQRRIQKAMHKLQVLTELYRRRELEEQAIAAYYEKKRQEKIYLAQQQFQRQQYYAALQEQQLQDEYRLWVSAQKSAACQPACQALAERECEESESESESEEESHQDQLAQLVKLIFGVEPEVEEEQVAEDEDEEVAQDEDEEVAENKDEEVAEDEEVEFVEYMQDTAGNMQEETMALDKFVDYIQAKAQSSEEDTPMDDGEQDDIVLAMEHIDDNESMDNERDNIILAMEHINDNRLMDEDYIKIPSLVKSNDIQDLVDEILTGSDDEQEFTMFADEDPVKIAKYDALGRMEQELNEIQQQHEDHVLHVTLNFSERAASPDTLITATTAENREFLSYEDRIVKILLKLDMIESDGDSNIRNERKSLVKKAEDMLGKLDEIKLKEWSRVSQGDDLCN